MKYNNIKTFLALFMAVTVFASSCQKDNGIDGVNTGEATVTIDMKGVGKATGNNAKAGLRASASSSKSVATPAVQRQVVKFNDQFNVTATLREVTTTAPALRASAKRADVTATGEGDVLPLADGTAYTVVVYKDGNEVTTETFTQGEGEHKFNIEAGNYTYVAYAYGDAGASGADRDPLWVSGSFSVEDGANTLAIVLEHKLTEVTVVFNAGSGREITAINAGTLAPNHDYTFNEETGVVSFGAATTAASISFAGQTAGQTWTSAPAMIAVEDTDNGTVELTGVTINGIDGAVSSDGWALRAGVQYTLELNLGDKEEEEGFEIGGFIWAPGNLVYNDGSYGFAAPTEQGDFWYFNWPLPVGEGTAPSIADMPEYDVNRDPCTLVPGGEWYTPSSEEYATLIATPGVDTDWQYHYGGTSTEDRGVFYGTDDLQLASENSADYLFFPGNGGHVNKYWTYNSENTSNAASIQFGGYNKPNTVGFSEQKSSTDIKIRCVKNAN
ncbi:hypothetical protein [Sphingobacterium sp. FBM7-1]|uniref:hypothetical protein n=1 Tax=Sphingobacterium sp. FBM7-1 TaxID=2886688 RepID=UPI001D12F90F|nr:hypothetical protein [Sphingobacterium sp. FBM7-1]MCC2598828.1 hypothetical protein [Sphingobacterium sp. FBM7-1]